MKSLIRRLTNAWYYVLQRLRRRGAPSLSSQFSADEAWLVIPFEFRLDWFAEDSGSDLLSVSRFRGGDSPSSTPNRYYRVD